MLAVEGAGYARDLVILGGGFGLGFVCTWFSWVRRDRHLSDEERMAKTVAEIITHVHGVYPNEFDRELSAQLIDIIHIRLREDNKPRG